MTTKNVTRIMTLFFQMDKVRHWGTTIITRKNKQGVINHSMNEKIISK